MSSVLEADWRWFHSLYVIFGQIRCARLKTGVLAHAKRVYVAHAKRVCVDLKTGVKAEAKRVCVDLKTGVLGVKLVTCKYDLSCRLNLFGSGYLSGFF